MSTDTSGLSDSKIAELKERYRVERERRLRPEGNAQYRPLSAIDDEFDRDPYVPELTRDPITDDVEVVIVGGGFGGMLTAVNLVKAGIRNFRVIDKAGDFGGTWYWNRYPGAACDVESYCYLPLLEETGYTPTEKYAKAPEIFAHCQRIGKHFDLYAGALFQTEIRSADWDDKAARWTITTDRGDKLTTKFMVIAGGVLHKAKLPGIPGIETFAGKAFHTSRWDYDFTGGSPTQPLTGLSDKRVGIIGTGATAVQVVPRLAGSAKELFVFQRTPAAVGVRGNRPTDPQWASSLKPGWQRERIENFTSMISGHNPPVDLVDDGWTQMLKEDTRRSGGSPERAAELQKIDFANMEEIRARVDSIVQDKATADALKPWYHQLCKRPCFHDEYLAAFNQPNVTLVDTGGVGVEQVTPAGVVVDGKEYPLDVLIYASGFEVTSGYTHRIGFSPRGRDGISLDQAWGEGPATLHGVMTRGFPNLMMVSTVQGGQTINFVHYITETSEHIAEVIKRCETEHVRTIEPTPEAQDAWLGVIFSTLADVGMYNFECTPSYMNNEGVMGGPDIMKSARGAAYMGNPFDYFGILKTWRGGELDGVEITRETAAA